jgi:hypothetical protein
MIPEDTEGFKGLLNHFVALLERAKALKTDDPNVPISLKAAIVGYSYHNDVMNWGRDDFLYVNRFLTEDPRMVDFNIVEGGEEGFEAFMCLALGTFCGRFDVEEWTGEEVERHEWALLAFMTQHNEEICTKYKQFLGTEGG